MQKGNYGLFTAITMITGIVVGSGIFFKSDDVLMYTNGNMMLGILVFVIAAIAIIFGCLTISQLATRTDKPGGIIAYAEEFLNIKIASSFGWFQTFLYLPTLVAVVGWVSGTYICQLFGMSGSNLTYSVIGFGFMILFFGFNILSAKFGGIFQNASMIIKLIPLVVLAIIGIFFGNPGEILSSDLEMMKNVEVGAGWIAAFAPIAFSFDGWIVATSIAHEIKDSKKNLPIALTVAPIIILVVYIGYFLGVTTLAGPDVVVAQGNDSVYTAIRGIFGENGARILLVFIVVSVLGTLNGLIMGLIRMPYSLAIRGMLPFSNFLAKENKKLGSMPINSAIFGFVISAMWLVIHYLTVEIGMRGDVSEISICVSYLNYILLYLVVIRLARKGEVKNKFMGYVVPALAILGSCVILLGSITNEYFLYFLVICYGIMAVGYYFGGKSQSESK